METNRKIEQSRQVYRVLLGLYPQEHRAEYGADMVQVFTDQCRAASQEGKLLTFPALWLRTVTDLCLSALREQLASPHFSAGLLEPVPNKPLPWKGVALVLLPGLIFFASQVAQLTGQDWFFLMVFRAAYFMILPVLVVWIWKRKFPIWGLVPLGLLFKTLLDRGFRSRFVWVNDSNPVFNWLAQWIGKYPEEKLEIGIVIGLLLSIITLLWIARLRISITGKVWIWLGIYILLMVTLMIASDQQYLYHLTVSGNGLYSWMDDRIRLYQVLNNFYFYGGFLLLILLGGLLVPRYGRLVALLPLGYLLPTIIYGRIANNWPAPATPEFTFMLTVGAAALIFRFLVALAGPLWIVRSATGHAQQQASSISLIALLALQAIFNLWIFFSNGWDWQRLNIVFLTIAQQIIFGAGIALALVLYRVMPEKKKVELIHQSVPS